MAGHNHLSSRYTEVVRRQVSIDPNSGAPIVQNQSGNTNGLKPTPTVPSSLLPTITGSGLPSSTLSAPSSSAAAAASKAKNPFWSNLPLSISVVALSILAFLILVMAIAMWWVRRRRRDRAGTGSTTDLLASPDLEKGSRGFDTSSIMTNETGESSSMGGHSVMVPYSQLSERPGYSGRPGFQVMRQHRPPAIIVPPNTYAEERPTSPVYGLHDQPPATSRPLPKVPHASPQLLNPHDTYHPDKYVQTPIVELPEIRRSLINGRKPPPNLRPLNLRADLSPMPIPVSAFSNKSAGRASARMSSYQTGQPSPLHNTLAPAMAVVGGFPPELTKSSGIDDGNKRKSWKNVPLSPIVPMSARPPMKSPNPEIRVRSPRSLPNSPTEYDSHRKSRPPSYRSNNSSRQPSGKENAMSPPGIASAVLKSAGSIFSVALTPAAPNSAALKTAPRSAFSPSMAPLREDDEKRASSLTMVLNSMSSNLPEGSPLAKELTIPLPVTPAAAAPVTPLRLRKLQLGSD